ncbi:hypothetical protein Aduo_014909 [Ancylostoma duodenale]
MVLPLLSLLLFSLYCGSQACPYGGITAYYIDQCYVYSNLKTTWVSAEFICQYMGGHLISIQSDQENGYVARVLHTPSRKEFFIGAYVNGHTWEWSDYDVKFIYTNFRGSMFNNSDNVASMLLTNTYYSKWNILSTNSLVPNTFACQVPSCAFKETRKRNERTLDKIAYYDNTTSYYYFGTVSNQESYNDAEDDCKRIGGHLPSISNAYQNAAVQDAAHKLLGTNNGGKIILGYSNLINYGFSWSDGNPSTYTNWAPGEPVTAVAGVAWMDMLTGWWNTAAPFAASHFICALPAYRHTC